MEGNPAHGGSETPGDAQSLNALIVSMMYRVESLIIGGPCWPMEEVKSVLAPRDGQTIRVFDAGSESNAWACEMASLFPSVEIVTVESAPANPPPNCKFEKLNLVTDDISHLLGQFDVLHLRRIGRWAKNYLALVHKLTGILKPGGLLLFIEPGRSIYDADKKVAQPASADSPPGTTSWLPRFWLEVKTRVPIIVDLPTEMSDLEDHLLQWVDDQHQLENARANNIYVPIGWPGTAEDGLKNGEEVGQLLKDTILRRFHYFRPLLLAGGMTEEEYDQLIRNCEAEVTELPIKCYVRWHFIVARRKLGA